MIHYYLYKTRNIVNNKEYIGIHKTNNLRDGYIGCGIKSYKSAQQKYNQGVTTHFINGVLKHGYDSFIKEVLYHFNSYEEALEMEKHLVTENYIRRKDTYNLKIGGGASGANLKQTNYYELTDFNGITYKGWAVMDFCEEKNLDYTSILKLLRGVSKTSQGYYIKDKGFYPRKILIFNLETEDKFETFDLNKWCKDNLPKAIVKTTKSNYLVKVLNKKWAIYDNKYWVCYEDEYKGYIDIDLSKVSNFFVYEVKYKNEIFEFDNVSDFIIEKSLNKGYFYSMLKGNFKQCSGYSLVSKKCKYKSIKNDKI